MDETSVKRAKTAYAAYGQTTDFKNYQGLPMPEWDELTERIQQAWIAAAGSVSVLPDLNQREVSQIEHAKQYADHFADAGVPGHGQFILLAKLARALGL